MSYRKFKADHLFTGSEMLGSDKVLLTKPNGEVEGVIDETDAGEDIEVFKGVITPGFINAHCHLELSHMKGLIPEKTGLVDFVYRIVNERHPVYRQAGFAEGDILSAIAAAENEMHINGIVAVGDICNNLLTQSQKSKGRLAYYNFIEASGWLPSVSQPRFERALHLYNQFSSHNSQLTAGSYGDHNSIVPHAPYSVSGGLWKLITPYFENKVVSIHNQETAFEDEFFKHGTGDFVRMYELMKIANTHHQPTNRSSLQSYFNYLIAANKIILVHNTFTKPEDIEFVKQQSKNREQTFFCICINANQYIENALPPVELLRKTKCNIVLGTDSLASNRGLNILDEMKAVQNNFPGISLMELLQWATLNGSKALSMDNELGTFENSKKPGVVIIENTDSVNLNKETTARRIL